MFSPNLVHFCFNMIRLRNASRDVISTAHRAYASASIALAICGIALAVSAWFVISSQSDQLAQKVLSFRAENKRAGLQGRINQYFESVADLRAFFDSSSHQIGRQEFTKFAGFLLRERPGLQSLSWIPRVQSNERAAVERAAREDGYVDFHIKAVAPDGGLSPSPEYPEYFPIFFSTMPITSSFPGIDLNSGPMRRRTLERARDNNEVAASSVFMLHDGEGDRRGIFVLLPVYKTGLPHVTAEERQRNLIGFTHGTFQISVMLESIGITGAESADFDYYLYGNELGARSTPIYFHSSRLRTISAELVSRDLLTAAAHWTGELEVGGTRWTFVAVPIPGGPGTSNHANAWIMLIAGLSLTGFVVAYVWTSGRQSERFSIQGRRFNAALNNMSQGLLMFDSAERLVVCNDRYLDMYGLSRDVVKPGCSLREVLQHRTETGHLNRNLEEYRAQLLGQMSRGKTTRSIVETAGREISIVDRPMTDGGWVATHEDITEQRHAEAKISYMALHDGLTDLPNRILLGQLLVNRLAHLDRDQKCAVFYLDLDHFKHVNDTLGHPIGDMLLRQVSERLRGCLRESDSIARLGGDEFAILQGNVTQPSDVTTLAARIIEIISAPFNLNSHLVVVGISVGIAIAPTDGADPDRLFKAADLALYRAKAEGRGTFRFFEPEMDACMQARRALETDLRDALLNGQFELYYQPLVDFSTGRISGFEALIRLNHPQRGLISPAEFIPLAEETGLIVPIGEWVLRRACEQAATWPNDISIAVNLSPVQFKAGNLTQIVIQTLARSGLPANRLELEITESVLLGKNKSTIDILNQLRALGVRISMDDFGTGYSSLSYLRSFPFDKLKLDQSFVRDFSSASKESLAIIRAVASLGTSLGMKTLAEGVETQAASEYLRSKGYNQAQGYLFGKPVPAKEVDALLAKQLAKTKVVA